MCHLVTLHFTFDKIMSESKYDHIAFDHTSAPEHIKSILSFLQDFSKFSGQNLCLAGSFPLYVYMITEGMSPEWEFGDVDIFGTGTTKSTTQDFGRFLFSTSMRKSFNVKRKSPSVTDITMEISEKPTIFQIVDFGGTNVGVSISTEEILEGFDIRACRVALEFKRELGVWRFVISEDTKEDIRSMRTVYCFKITDSNTSYAGKRIMKYCSRGFFIGLASGDDLIADVFESRYRFFLATSSPSKK